MPFNKNKRLNGINILVAIDAELDRMMLKGMFDLEGTNVIFRNDGQQALNLLQKADKNTFRNKHHNRLNSFTQTLQKRYKKSDNIIKTLATTFVTSYKRTPADIRRAIHAKDPASLSSITHGMKESAGYLEAHQLNSLATLAKIQVKQNDTNAYITDEKLAFAIKQQTDALRNITDQSVIFC